MFIAMSAALAIDRDHDRSLHYLQVLQERARVFYFVHHKQPSNCSIVHPQHAAHRGAPLRLTAQKHLHHRPVFLPHFKIIRAGLFWQRHSKDGGILLAVILDAAAGPMLGGLCQFFLLAPLMLSM